MLSSSSIRMLALLAITIIIAGCSSGSEPPREPPITTPKVGSAYMFDNYAKDSAGGIVPGSRNTSIRTILATNATVGGKSGVVQYLEEEDTTSMHFESNGDVAYFQPAARYPDDRLTFEMPVAIPEFTIPARWITFGYGSKAPMTIPSYDTTLTIDGGIFPLQVQLKATGTTSYIGTEDLTTSSGLVATQKGLLTVTINFTSPIAGGSVQTVDTIWFAPKLGIFVKDDGFATASLPATFGGDQSLGGNFNVLTSYALAN